MEKNAFRYVEAERRILAMIESGALVPGDKLPSLRNFCRIARVSLSTASQAYMELERKGLIEARPRSGYYLRTTRAKLPEPQAETGPPSEPVFVNRTALIRNVLGSMGDPDILQLGLAHVGPELMPFKALTRLLGKAMRESGEKGLEYDSVQGNVILRRQIAQRMAGLGVKIPPSEILVTSGCMEALYISLRVLTKPGDNVLIASPTYYCFLQLLETLGLRAVELPSHPARGVDPAELRRCADHYGIKACILTPNFNNPDGSLMPEGAKEEIVDFLAGRRIPLVEDDVFGDIHFSGRRPGVCKEHDRKGLVLYCSSFSKTLAPGWRVGWMVPGRFLNKAMDIKATTNVCCVTPTQTALAEYLETSAYDRQLRRLRCDVERQMRTMQACIARTFPEGTRVTDPKGGTELWLELPEGVDTVKLFSRAKAEGIGICPGSIFSTRDRFDNFIRLSCGKPWSEEVEQAVTRLGTLAGDA
jgi:DNA-binding transcriptional MocR family regulator